MRLDVALPLVRRAPGLLIAALAVVITAVVGSPESQADYANDDGVDTVYPLMLVPLLAVVAVAGLAVHLRPATARAAAAVSGVTGVQLLGIAVVAARDWRNFAGVGYATWERGDIASLLAIVVFFAALAVVLISCAVYGNGLRPGETPTANRTSLVAGLLVAAGVPFVVCRQLDLLSLTAVGQFALWWSVPWGVGIVVAASAPTPAARRAALATVLFSAATAYVGAAASPLFGLGLRLPSG
jgi:hypothetical protein